MCSGVWLWSPAEPSRASAPASRRKRMASRRPRQAATCTAVLPLLLGAFSFAPRATSRRHTSMWPISAAWKSGVES